MPSTSISYKSVSHILRPNEPIVCASPSPPTPTRRGVGALYEILLVQYALMWVSLQIANQTTSIYSIKIGGNFMYVHLALSPRNLLGLLIYICSLFSTILYFLWTSVSNEVSYFNSTSCTSFSLRTFQTCWSIIIASYSTLHRKYSSTPPPPRHPLQLSCCKHISHNCGVFFYPPPPPLPPSPFHIKI